MGTTTRRLAWVLMAAILVAANVKIATAHRWSSWHQPNATVNVYNFAVRHAEAEAALSDWDTNTTIYLPRKTSHTELSVFDGNYGDTGWSGLASIEDTGFGWWDCWWWCHITHAHARVNTFYNGNPAGFSMDIQGIFCQEIGHTFGLAHSNTGDCMGKSYYNDVNTTGPHNVSDINSMYGPCADCPCPAGTRHCGVQCVPTAQRCPCPAGTRLCDQLEPPRCVPVAQRCPTTQ